MDPNDDFPFNRDWKRRNEILKGFFRTGPLYAALDPEAGFGHYHNLPVEAVQQLLQERFLDPANRQNDSSPTHVFFDFMKRFPGVTAHGYIIGPERDDYRVAIEGIAYRGPISSEMRQEATKLFGAADEFILEGDTLYVWYD
jgi:hypothetical protein